MHILYFCEKYLPFVLKNKVTVLVPVAINVFEPNSVIAATLKYLNSNSLVGIYIPEFVRIEIGNIIPAIPPGFNNCFVLSINKHSISELSSVKYLYSSKLSFPFSRVFLNEDTE